MGEVEVYLGGFSSPLIRKGNVWGYGIGATNKRLIGFKNWWARLAFLLGPTIAGVGGATHLAREFLSPSSYSPNQTSLTLGIPTTLGFAVFVSLFLTGPILPLKGSIGELDSRKDFAILKTAVQRIEMVEPRGLTIGYLVIIEKSGVTVKINIWHKKSFQQTKKLIQEFDPESRFSSMMFG